MRLARLLTAFSAKNSYTSAAGGMRPFKSSDTRRMNSASSASGAGSRRSRFHRASSRLSIRAAKTAESGGVAHKHAVGATASKANIKYRTRNRSIDNLNLLADPFYPQHRLLTDLQANQFLVVASHQPAIGERRRYQR